MRVYVVYGFVVAMVVVVIDPLCDPVFKLRGRIIIIQQEDVFHGSVIAFDLPLGHWVIGPGADMPDIVIFELVF